MNKEHFQILLEDLYEKYNHTKKSDVPNLVEKYLLIKKLQGFYQKIQKTKLTKLIQQALSSF